MISVTPSGRRAEEFAALLDGRVGVRATHRGAPHSDLLDVVGALRSVPAVDPRPEFVADLRTRLMAEAEVVLSEVERKLTLPAPQHHRRDRRIGIAVGAITLVGVTSSVAMASQGALPGDTLYPIKRALEGASTTLTFNDAAKGEQMLDNAAGRLSEVEALVERGSKGDVQLPVTLDAFSTQTKEAATVLLDEYAANGDDAAVKKLRDFTASSMATLGNIGDSLPADAIGQLTNAVNVLRQVDELAQQLCPSCGGDLLEVPSSVARILATSAPGSAVPTLDVPKPGGKTTLPEKIDEPDGPATTPPANQPTTPPAVQPTPSGTPKPSPKPDEPKGAVGTLSEILTGEGGLVGEEGLVDGLLGGLFGKDGLLGGE